MVNMLLRMNNIKHLISDNFSWFSKSSKIAFSFLSRGGNLNDASHFQKLEFLFPFLKNIFLMRKFIT